VSGPLPSFIADSSQYALVFRLLRTAQFAVFPKEGSFSAMVGRPTRRWFHFMVGAALTVGTLIIGSLLPASLTDQQSWVIRAALVAAAIIVFTFYLRWQARSQEESPEAIKGWVSQLEPELREQVQARSYGARSSLIEAPLRELDLDITPRLGWVRDPRLIEPEPLSEKVADDIVAAFESSKRRLLIVGEPGTGKTIAAYSLIEYLDNTEGDQRIPLLVNLSAWEAQDDFEAFLVDYLYSSVGYEVHERAVARAFIDSGRYSLILDGLDEIPAGLRQHFSERFDEFVGGLPSEVGVVVTCRTQEYEQLLAAHSTGLGLVQAVEILPFTSEQLNSAFVELAKVDEGWEGFLSQQDHTAYQRVRELLSNPLFLNLAVVGRLSAGQLLDWSTTEQELQDLVLDNYLDRAVADQRLYEPAHARRYLAWIASFLNGDEVSPFGLKETDFTVFDLADLTPPDPPRRYRLFGALIAGLLGGLVSGLFYLLLPEGFVGLVTGLAGAVGLALVLVLPTWGRFKRSAVSSRVTLVWPSTRRRLLDFFHRAGRGLVLGLLLGLGLGEGAALGYVLDRALAGSPVAGGLAEALVTAPVLGLGLGLFFGLFLGPPLALVSGLLQTRSVLITSRTPKEARSRSLIAALSWLVGGLVGGLPMGLAFGLVVGLGLALRNGGWFVVLQKVAHRRLARAGNFPQRPYDFLEWGVETQIFRRVGGGVRFRHNLIQQHLASTSEGVS
jgi:hypothetical protein